ncbi:hypothetical protein LVJ94_21605 [Pendulispora rubella]|uniref:Uncharacterized protein n=1 Tax=Pendulispora rubella TaxID=2741070 RepID=A0ABZ2LFY8_9BACT
MLTRAKPLLHQAGSPHLPSPPARPGPAGSWTEKGFVLSGERPDAIRSAIASAHRNLVILDTSTESMASELTDRVLDLRDKLLAVGVPPEAQERRDKVLFALSSSKVSVEVRGSFGDRDGSMLRTVARVIHGIVVSKTEIRDEVDRLVLSASRDFDPRALTPRSLWLLSAKSSPSDLRDAAKNLVIDDETEVSVVELHGARRDERLARELDVFDAVKKVGKGRYRRAAIEPFVASEAALRIATTRPLEPRQLAASKKAARALDAILFDGWGFYDPAGHAIVLRNNMVDPHAKVPGARR